MPHVVFDASSIVGALLKADSTPERALLLARSRAILCLSPDVEAEIRTVLARPKFRQHLAGGRGERILDLLTAASAWFHPTQPVRDCRNAKDDKYLELALAAKAEIIVSSDEDLLALDPWRDVRIVTPAEYVRMVDTAGGDQS